MSVLSDTTIIDYIENDWLKINPFVSKQIKKIGRKKIISYGLSSYGYDIRLANEFYVFHNAKCGVIDPKNFDSENIVPLSVNNGDALLIPPNSFVLARSYEYLSIPREVVAICIGKSTYARCGIIVNVTPLEPEWEGYITMELSNTTPLPVKVYSGEGIAQLMFLKGDFTCKTSYADKQGKYQKQEKVTPPRV